ncbi:MAG: hypothetical protein HUU15_09205 [Candidatus Brocadiae bacterium]|nr:hypothetical protein [Candidatus Brocadiia bacterium]
MRLLPAIALLACSAAVFAQQPAPGRTSDAPRPGMKWVEAMPEEGRAPVTLVSGGSEKTYWEVAPGGKLAVPVGGPNQRLLVQVRRMFGSRTDAPSEYSFLWSLDGGEAVKAGFKSKPHASAVWKGRPDVIPGTQDALVIDVPMDGRHVVTVAWGEKRERGLAFRFLVEIPRPPEEALKAARENHDDHWWMSVTSRLTFGYDDNIWNFSDDDVHATEERNTNHPNDKYDKVGAVDDGYMSSFLDARILSPLTTLGRFTIGGRMENRLYLVNTRKNRDELGVFLRHSPVERLEYGVSFDWTPDIYYRHIDSVDIPGSTRQHAHYDRYEIGGRLRYRWARGLSTTGRYTWELRDWNSKFNEKDTFRHHWEAGVDWAPAKWLKLEFDLEYVHARSRATGEDPDLSFQEISPRLEAVLKFGRIEVGGGYRFASRTYTTKNERSQDPVHAGRRDRRHEWTAMVKLITGESSYLMLEIMRRKVTTRLPGRDSAADSADFDDNFEHDGSRIEFTWEFKFP